MDGSNSKSTTNWIYLSIIAVLAAAGIYMFVDKNKTEQKSNELSEQVVEISDSKSQIENEYQAALSRLDLMKSENASMDSLINSKNGEISDMRRKITEIISNKNASEQELKTARDLIASFNNKMDSYRKEVDQLKAANIKLVEEKNILTSEKEKLTSDNSELENVKLQLEDNNTELSRKVELAKVLHASNITLEPINMKRSGLKEVSTSRATRADLIRIKFNLDDNRISETGEKQVYVVVYTPNGETYGLHKFRLSDGTEKTYTASKSIPYKQGETTKDIVVDWVPNEDFEKGDYNVEIYHMGFKIGGNSVKLK